MNELDRNPFMGVFVLMKNSRGHYKAEGENKGRQRVANCRTPKAVLKANLKNDINPTGMYSLSIEPRIQFSRDGQLFFNQVSLFVSEC